MSAEIVLGGPDPFPEETRGGCPASEGSPWPYFCTRDAGHEPPHLALATGPIGVVTLPGALGVVAVWPPYRELAP